MENDIIFLNEHWLQVAEISSLNGLFLDDVCFLKSIVNPELVLKGRPYCGVGFICRLQTALLFSSVPCDNINGHCQAFSQVKRRKWRPDVTILGRFLGYFRHFFAGVLSIIA